MITHSKRERPRRPQAVLLRFRPGAKVFDREHPPKNLFLVKSGILRVGAADNTVFDYLGPGEMCGERCLDANGPKQVAQAVTDATVYSIPEARTTNRVCADRRLAGRVLKCLIRRMERYEESIGDLVGEPTERRLAKLLLRFVRTKEGPQGWAEIPNLTNPEIARTIGTTRWQVSRFINHLRQLKIVKRGEGLWVNVDALRAFLASH